METKQIQISDMLEIDWAILNAGWQIPHGDRLFASAYICKVCIRSQALTSLNSLKHVLWTENGNRITINYCQRSALVSMTPLCISIELTAPDITIQN